MEKHTHTFLSSSSPSFREHRLLGQNVTPETADSEGKKLESRIQNPSEKTDQLRKEIGEFSGKSEKHTEIANSILFQKLKERAAQEKALQDARDLTSVEKNPDWKKIVEGIKPEKSKPAEDTVKLAREMIKSARGKIADLAGKSLEERPKNALQQVEAYNKVILEIQALDPTNTVTFVEGGTGGGVDDARLKTVQENRSRIFDVNGDFEKSVKGYKEASTGAGKEEARKKMESAGNKEKENLWKGLAEDMKQAKPYVNSEAIVQAYVALITEIDTEQKRAVDSAEGKTDEEPVEAPRPKAAKAEKVSTLDKESALKDFDGEKVDAAVNAKNEKKLGKALAELNKDPKVKANAEAIAKAINENRGKKGLPQNVEAKDGVLSVRSGVSVLKNEADSRPNESKELTNFKGFLQAIIDFLKTLSKEFGVTPKELFSGGSVDVTRMTAANTPTLVLESTQRTVQQQSQATRRLAEEAALRARTAPTPKAKLEAEAELRTMEKKSLEQEAQGKKLKNEVEKSQILDAKVERKVDQLQAEAKSKKLPVDIQATPEKRGVIVKPLPGAPAGAVKSFGEDCKQALGAERIEMRGNIIIINYFPNNTGTINLQGQVNGGSGTQSYPEGMKGEPGKRNPNLAKEAAAMPDTPFSKTTLEKESAAKKASSRPSKLGEESKARPIDDMPRSTPKVW